MREQILKLGMKDTVRNSLIALPIIILFEVYMIISWMINSDEHNIPGSYGYLTGYIMLLVVTGIVLAFIMAAKKNVEKYYKTINIVDHIYAVCFVAWALAFTYVGSELRGNFDYLIYITIITIVPVFCYLSSKIWICIQLISASFMIYLACGKPHFHAFLINFSVFTIISIVASWSMHQIRRNAYGKQIELKNESQKVHELAYTDILTGLSNRRSYLEELDKIVAAGIPDDLILAMFDVNGLKKVNDNIGHEAGDQLIQGAASCLRAAFSAMGSVYRVGGDEFTGILRGSDEELKKALELFEQKTYEWSGELVKELRISAGTASVRDNPGASLSSLETIADNEMYAKKQAFYKSRQ